MENVSFDEFKKLEIKIGTIVSVEVVPDTDKLLKLLVDIGEGELRTIISGIREYFENPEEMLGGKQVPILINLEPREIRGIKSEGMILAVGGEGGFTLLSPVNKVENGAEVR